MNTASLASHEFLMQSPIGAKTAVLLATNQQASEFREASKARPIRLSHEREVVEFVTSIRKENRSHKLAVAMDTATHFVIQRGLPPTGESDAPFPWFSRSGGPFQNSANSYIEIQQNKVECKTIAELQSQFRYTSGDLRPKIVFVVENREKAYSTFSKLNSASDVFTPTPSGVRRVELPDTAATDFERIYFTRFENHRAASLATLPETDDRRVDFINELMLIKSQKVTLDPTHLLPKLKEMGDLANKRLANSDSENRLFWTAAWIHVLVEQAYIQESAKLEIQTAISLLPMIDEPGLASHVRRFSNQVLGTSPDALEYLRQGKILYEALSPNSYAYLMYQPSYLGLLQNYHMTELYQSERSDPEVALSSYEFAKQEAPYFTNLAMLGNSAALGYLTAGDAKRALEIFDQLESDNADEIDRWSVTCNRLIAMYEAFGEVDANELVAFAEILRTARVSKVWQYHVYRFALNLIQMDKYNQVRDRMWELIEKSDYFQLNGSRDVAEYQRTIIEKDFQSHSSGGKLWGQMGDYVMRTGIFPSTDFDWT